MRWVVWISAALATVLAALYVAGKRKIARVEPVDYASVKPSEGAQFVVTRSGRVHYQDLGTGPPIVLIHGSGRSIADWQEGVIERLVQDHRVIAYDCYGFGRSERNRKFTYGYNLWVAQVVDVLDALGIEHVTVVGHSVGGALALMLAAEHPSRVDHVVTVGTGIAVEPQQFIPVVPGVGELMIARETMFGPPLSPGNKQALEEAFTVRGTRTALLQYIRRQMTIDGLRVMLTGTFSRVTVPILHISGTNDRNISPKAARRLAKITGGAFLSIKDATHNVHADTPDELVTAIRSFLSRRH